MRAIPNNMSLIVTGPTVHYTIHNHIRRVLRPNPVSRPLYRFFKVRIKRIFGQDKVRILDSKICVLFQAASGQILPTGGWLVLDGAMLQFSLFNVQCACTLCCVGPAFLFPVVVVTCIW